MSAAPDFVKRIRAFNRFYTLKIGLITKRFLESSYSLVQARVLFELNNASNMCAKDLVEKLNLDPTYLSKILKQFEKKNLITRKVSAKDSRKQILTLARKGKDEYSRLRKISNVHIASLVQNLTEEEKQYLVSSMGSIEKLLSCTKDSSDLLYIRSHRPGDIGYVIHRHGVLYAQEYGFNDQFDSYVAKGMARFIENYNPRKEHLWLAETDNRIVGSVAIVQRDDDTAQLRWMIVEPAQRGKKIGKRLVKEAIRFARQKGYKKIMLWTIDFLHAARKLYSNEDFVLTQTKQSEVWGKVLTEEKWELLLR